MAKRWLLLMATNVAAVAIVTIVLLVLPLDYTTTWGLAGICLVVGLVGAFASLFWSIPIARNFYGVRGPNEGTTAEQHLSTIVAEVATSAGIATPEAGIYDNREPNAFATGPNQKHSLIAVSTGLLERCDEAELRAIVAHEVGHIRSGDMVTMTLLLGVANAFVLFLARIVARAIDSMVQSDENPFGMGIWAYWILVWVLESLFMLLAYIPISWYSRRREFAADATAASLGHKEGLIAALRKIDANMLPDEEQPQTQKRRDMYAFAKLNNKTRVLLFDTHPPIVARVEYLETGAITSGTDTSGSRPGASGASNGAWTTELTGKRFTLVHGFGSLLLFGLAFLYMDIGIEVARDPEFVFVPFVVSWLGLLAWAIASFVGIGDRALGRPLFAKIGPYVTATLGVSFFVAALLMPLGLLGTIVEIVLVALFALLFLDSTQARRHIQGEPAAQISIEWIKKAFTSDTAHGISRLARAAIVGGLALVLVMSNFVGTGGGGGVFASSGSGSRSSRTAIQRVPSYVKIDVAVDLGLDLDQIVGITGRLTRRTPLGGEMWEGTVDLQLVPNGNKRTVNYAIVHE